MKKRISVITGGGGGMGKAIAKELGQSTTLVLADLDEQLLQRAKQELDELGCESYLFPADIRDENRVKELAEYSASLGDVVNVIHTAGVSPTDHGADAIISTNAMGTLYLVNAFYPVIAPHGVMINFASMAAYTMEAPKEWYEVYDALDAPDLYERFQSLAKSLGDDDFFGGGIAYCISKRFVIYFTQKNVLRFAKKGCRILSVSPGPYLTPMHEKLIENQPETAESQLDLIPCGRWGRPYEVAALTTFLCSPGAQFISGVDILTDAGQISNIFVEQIE